MQCFQFFFISVLAIYNIGGWRLGNAVAPQVSKTITVSWNGRADFSTISDAIEKGVPQGNSEWIKIHVHEGLYRERVIIPTLKPYIVLQGVSSRTTIVAYSSGGTLDDPALKVCATNFVAKDISFKNTYNLAKFTSVDVNQNPIKQALAASVLADKVSFYRCGFYGVQDTLLDSSGRHFFKHCYIEGFVDFIFGNGQSVYENCNINVTGSGYIAAQHRNSENEPTGFVFKFCNVFGISNPNSVYLGRPWGPYSRVIYYKSIFSQIIVPEGWDAWYYKGQESNFTFVEIECSGPGSNMSQRVKWTKKLTSSEWKFFVTPSFNNADGWIQAIPAQPVVKNSSSSKKSGCSSCYAID